MGLQPLMIWLTVSGFVLQKRHKGLLFASISMIAPGPPVGWPAASLRTCHAVALLGVCSPISSQSSLVWRPGDPAHIS
eukprot:6202288-Ditylum_brightwellii.AAC.1